MTVAGYLTIPSSAFILFWQYIMYIFSEGSVVMGLVFWSVSKPYDRLSTVLQSQFDADMRNIWIGFLYEYYGK